MSSTTATTAGAAPAPTSGGLIGALRSPAGMAKAALLGVAFVALFHRWFILQHRHARAQLEDWGHSYAIPFIALYLVWIKREELSRIVPRAFWPGLAPMLVGIMSYFVCVVGIKNTMLQGFSVILTLFGMVLLLTGPGAMRVLMAPLAYLVFAVKISPTIMDRITFQLRLLASEGAYVALSLIGAVAGFQVDIAGNKLTVISSSGAHDLDVAEACSGMRMVIAFFALAGAVALISCRSWWQRVALVLLATPVAVLMNIVRVSVLGVGTLVDPDIAQGDAHVIIGTLLLLPGLGLFMLVVWALNKAVHENAKGGAA